MRFESVHVERYGCLADLSTGDDALPSIVVVLGPNESGKSTFFSFLTTLLFGFSPATRAAHPFTPWSGGDPEGRGRIRLDDGALLEVRRRLASAPRGRLTTEDGARNVANRRLPAVRHVTRGVFRQVYALTLAELARIEGESWALVQDRLIGAMGVKDVRAARTVAADFEAEANRLWRPDRRGRPRARVLVGELAELNAQLGRALELDRALREKAGERAEAERALEALRAEAEEDRSRHARLDRRLNRLLPVRRALARIEELGHATGAEGSLDGPVGNPAAPPESLDGLPDDPAGRLEALRTERREAGVRIEQLDREAAVCSEGVLEYRERHERVAEIEEAVRAASGHMVAMRDMKRDVEEAEAAVAELEARCAEAGDALLSVPWGEVPRADYAAIDVARLRQQVDMARKLRQSLLSHRAGAEGGGDRASAMPKPGWSSLIGGLTLLAGGVGLAAWWLLYPDVVFETVGGTRITATFGMSAAIFIGGGGMVTLMVRAARSLRHRRYRLAVEDAESRRAERIGSLTGEEEAASEAAREMVAGLPVREALLEVPGLDLSTGVERMTDLVARLQRQRGELAGRRERIKRARARIAEVREALSFHSGGDTPVAARSLDALLEGAIKAREGARAAEQQLERIAAERKEAQAARRAAAVALQDLEARLAPFAEGDPDRGAEAARERLQRWRRAVELRQELERAHPELDRLEAEIAEAKAEGESWEALDEALEESRARQDERTGRAEELQATIARLGTEIEHLEDGETADTVEGRIAAVREQIREAKENRDRAFILARLVREADRRFRDENHPELLRRAGRYLGEVTHGRYDRIELGDPGDESFYLREPGGSTTRKVGETLSQGTREQVYLALRLAIIGHLDADRERLPLFMDETLVNWDAWRRDRAFGILERVAEERQVFIFTCHPAMAAELEDRGARIISLAVR